MRKKKKGFFNHACQLLQLQQGIGAMECRKKGLKITI